MTCVAAIVLVVTLLMALELTTRTFNRSPPYAASPRTISDSRLRELQENLEEVRLTEKELDDKIRFAASHDLAAIKAEVRKTRESCDKLDEQVKEAKNKATQLEAEIKALKESLSKNDENSEKVKEMEREIKKRRKKLSNPKTKRNGRSIGVSNKMAGWRLLREQVLKC